MKRFLGKVPGEIRYPDLERLVREGEAWREGRWWDFKAAFPPAEAQGKKDPRKELLADLSSFANADGGLLVIGVSAKDGIPHGLPGVSTTELDSQQIRLQALAREHLDPPLTRLVPHIIPGPPGLVFLLVEIPRSLTGPHAVWLDRDGRFWRRNAGGKYQMDVSELRDVFLEADRWLDAASVTRRERLQFIESGRYGAYGFPPGKSVLVLHSIPLGRQRTRLDLDSISPAWNDHFHPDSGLSYKYRYTVEGGFVFSNEDGRAALVHCFRNGLVELCVLLQARYTPAEKPELINGCRLTSDVGSWLEAIFKWQDAAGLEPPIACFGTLLNVNGRSLVPTFPWGAGEPALPFEGRNVELPDVVLGDHTNAEYSALFSELSRILWQSAGMKASPC